MNLFFWNCFYFENEPVFLFLWVTPVQLDVGCSRLQHDNKPFAERFGAWHEPAMAECINVEWLWKLIFNFQALCTHTCGVSWCHTATLMQIVFPVRRKKLKKKQNAKAVHFLIVVHKKCDWKKRLLLLVHWQSQKNTLKMKCTNMGKCHRMHYDWQWSRDLLGFWRPVSLPGSLKSFVCYNVSVVPIFSGWVGKPTTREAYLEEDGKGSGFIVSQVFFWWTEWIQDIFALGLCVSKYSYFK